MSTALPGEAELGVMLLRVAAGGPPRIWTEMANRFGVTAVHSCGSGSPVACHSPVIIAVSEVFVAPRRPVTRIFTWSAGLAVMTSALMSVDEMGSRLTATI